MDEEPASKTAQTAAQLNRMAEKWQVNRILSKTGTSSYMLILLWKFSFTYQTISQKNSITEVKNRLQASGGWGDFFLKSTLLAHYQLWTVLS